MNMKKEIGSFFEMYEPQIDREKSSSKWDKRWENPNLKLVCSGREAIEAVLMDLQHRDAVGNKVCILPQYTCDTVILPFIKHGWSIFFYPIDRQLAVDEQMLKGLFEQEKPSVLLMHTYYGVDTIKNVRPLIESWRAKQHLIFIEDMTQSLALWEENGKADYYLGSLRKWFPIPDGAFVCSDHSLDVEVRGENREFIGKKQAAQWKKFRYLKGDGDSRKEDFLQINREAEEGLYKNNGICRMSRFSRGLLEKFDVEKSLQQRTRNASYLKKHLLGCRKVKAVMDQEAEGPLYFPIFTGQREQLQEWLKAADIFAPVLWPVPEVLTELTDGDTAYAFERLLALPCDWRYTEKDMERIVKRIWEYEDRDR